MDLETLSQNTGLTVNFLERMENDEIYPTIGPLQKVARSLGVRLGTFLDDQFTRDPIISRIDQLGGVDPALHTGRTPRSSYIYQALGKGKSDRNMEPFSSRSSRQGRRAQDHLASGRKSSSWCSRAN